MNIYLRTLKFTYLNKSFLLILVLFTFSSILYAGDVKITQNMDFIVVDHKGKTIRIERIQDQSNHLTGGFSKTSRKCPPFCIQPMIVAPGVTTFGELEVIQFISDYVKTNKGILIDARTPSWHEKGTIPGSVNIPFTLFALARDDEKLITTMKQLGVERRKTTSTSYWTDIKDLLGLEKKPNPYWNFSSAKNILLWCNGMWCGQSPRAIKGLLKLGYPANKLHYYRSGMQAWQILGLTVTGIPEIVPEVVPEAATTETETPATAEK